ncbi:MAG: cyclase, partial [Armatimonadetes bacterium]|nr:cyclase [Armatimonadota bacterium]
EHADVRGPAGSGGGWVFRNVDDPNEVFILLEWTDLESARQFTQSEDLRQTMQHAGVVDQPDAYFLEVADRPPL